MDDSTKHHHPLHATHQCHHSPDVASSPPADAPPVASVANLPAESMAATTTVSATAPTNPDPTADLHQKSAAVNQSASTDLSNLASPGSQNQKQTTTFIGTDPIDQPSHSFWGTPFHPNPMLKDPPKHDPPLRAIDLTVSDSSPGHLHPPPPDKWFKYTFLDLSTVEHIDNCWAKEKLEQWCYKKYKPTTLNSNNRWLGCMHHLQPPPQSASAQVATPAIDLESRCKNLAISAANLNTLHTIWMQSHPGNSGNQN